MNNKPVIIVGTGGHAKVVADMLKLSNREILGFVDPKMDAELDFCGKKVLGDDSVISQYPHNEIELANGIGSLPGKKNRWKLADKMRMQGYSFATIVHPSSIIAPDVFLGEGVQVMAGVVIQSSVKIGKDSIINTGAIVDHDCNILKNCHLSPGVVCSGGVLIGENTHVGTGSIVIECISIGKNSIIAASSVVYRDVPDGMVLIQKKQQKLTIQGSKS